MGGGVFGQQRLGSGNTPFNELSFVIQQALARLNVATLVEVVAVHGGSTGPVGLVDVRPLVNQVDGAGNAMPHATIYGVPFFRVQGGANAVIVDPAPGDIGFALFADRDLSSVKAAAGPANPGSERRFDMADALYFGGWNITTPPTAYVQVTQAGINLVLPGGTSLELAPGQCTINAAATKINGTLEVTEHAQFDQDLAVATNLEFGGALTGTGAGGGGDATLQGSLTATGDLEGNGHSLSSHVHSGVQGGSSNTGGPIG